MPPKRKALPRANGRDQWNFISGSEALQYKEQLDAGEELDTDSLLKLLHADQACEALYSKSCKVKKPICQSSRRWSWTISQSRCCVRLYGCMYLFLKETRMQKKKKRTAVERIQSELLLWHNSFAQWIQETWAMG
jgi:hypothetical protein